MRAGAWLYVWNQQEENAGAEKESSSESEEESSSDDESTVSVNLLFSICIVDSCVEALTAEFLELKWYQ